jgi:hypothetical protein
MTGVEYLRQREWSMGCGGPENQGQCPDCCALSEAWLTRPGGWGDGWGHKTECSLAAALVSMGQSVDYYRPVPGYELDLWKEMVGE